VTWINKEDPHCYGGRWVNGVSGVHRSPYWLVGAWCCGLQVRLRSTVVFVGLLHMEGDTVSAAVVWLYCMVQWVAFPYNSNVAYVESFCTNSLSRSSLWW